MTALCQRMIDDMTVRTFSLNTQKIYVDRVAKFAKHFSKSPELLGPEEIRTFQLYLVNNKNAAWSTRNQYVSALRFLCRVTLGKEWAIQRPPVREVSILPLQRHRGAQTFYGQWPYSLP
jgi:integrase/recombinase XerD